MKKQTVLVLLALLLFIALPGVAETKPNEDFFGVLDGSEYRNSILGIGCNLPGWTIEIGSDEMVLKNQNGSIYFKDNDKEKSNITIMKAHSADTLQDVSIVIRDIKEYKEIFEAIGMKKVIDLIKQNFTDMIQSKNAYDIITDVIEEKISGNVFHGLSLSCKYMTIPVFQKQIYFFRNNFLVFLSYRSYKEDKTNDIIGHFYLVDTENK